jgi:hypothetical protein
MADLDEARLLECLPGTHVQSPQVTCLPGWVIIG